MDMQKLSYPRNRPPGGPKPKNAPSTVPLSDHSPNNLKKTRDLPNLSDCHGCGRRINYTNPDERLQLMDSVWRIVLLCKKCRKKVNSGKICSYCFKDTLKSAADRFSCGNCRRIVHNSCVLSYENSTPWSYCSSKLGVGISVCIDCWVPETMKSSIRVREERSDEKDGSISVAESANSRSLGQGDVGDRSLMEAANEAKSVLEKKVAIAVKAKETAVRKAVPATHAVELDKNALDLVAKKFCDDKGKEVLIGGRNDGNGNSDLTRGVDGTRRAFQLQDSLNSSSRILNNIGVMESSCPDLWKVSGSCGVLPKSMGLRDDTVDELIAECNDTLENGTDTRIVSVESTCVEADGSSCTNFGGSKPELITYKRNNRKRKERQQSGAEVKGGYICIDLGPLKPSLVTYKRVNKKRNEGQQSDVEANGSLTCDSGRLGLELVTYKRNKVKGKECQRSGLDVRGREKNLMCTEYATQKSLMFHPNFHSVHRLSTQRAKITAWREPIREIRAVLE